MSNDGPLHRPQDMRLFNSRPGLKRLVSIAFILAIAACVVIPAWHISQKEQASPYDTVPYDEVVDTLVPSPTAFKTETSEEIRNEYVDELKTNDEATLAPVWDTTFLGLDGTADSASMAIKFRERDSVMEADHERFEAGE